MPALAETLIPILRRVEQEVDDAKTDMDDEEYLFLIKSDGMNKQQHLGYKAMQLIAEIHPTLLRNVEFDDETGETRAICGDGGQVNVVVRL